MRPSLKILRRTAAAGGALALGLAAFAPTQALASDPDGKGNINTIQSWDGASQVLPFGCPDTTTYGQTITATGTLVKKFTFEVAGLSVGGSMVARGEVYRWDGTKATGKSLAESAPQTISYGDQTFHPLTFKANAKVKKGHQYVLFASIDKDYEACTDSYELGWGSVDGATYAGGSFVYQNNSGDESQWTATAWSNITTLDAAFKATLG